MKRGFWMIFAIGCVALLGQGFVVPFWGDDYALLVAAEQARLSGQPWWALFRPSPAWPFLSQDLIWRLIEGPFDANRSVAHWLSLFALAAATAATAWLAAGLSRLKWPELSARRVGFFAGLFFLIHAAHFLPLIWVSAIDRSLVVMFSAICLGCWVRAFGRDGSLLYFALSLASLVLAMLSSEIAVVLPSLMAIVGFWLWPQRAPNRATWVAGLIALVICIVWTAARIQWSGALSQALDSDPSLARNSFGLFAYFLNVPREAIRFALEGKLVAYGWAVVCAMLQFSALALLLASSLRRLRLKGVLVCLAFAIVACSPFLFFSDTSYAHYLSLALLPYAVVAGLAATDSSKLRLAAGLSLASALLATGVSQLLPNPALVGKARWAEQQLQHLEDLQQSKPNLFQQPVYLMITDPQRFYAIGLAGLRYRIGLTEVHLVSGCEDPNHERILRLPANAPPRFVSCETQPTRSP